MFCRILVLALLLAAPFAAHASAIADALTQLYEAEEYDAVVARMEKANQRDEILAAFDRLEKAVAQGAPYGLIFYYAQLSWAYAEGLKDDARRDMAAAVGLYLAIALRIDSAKCTDQTAALAQFDKFRTFPIPAVRHMCAKSAERRPLVRDVAQKYEFFLRDARRMDPAICAPLAAPDTYRARQAAAIAAIPDLLDSYLPLRGGC